MALQGYGLRNNDYVIMLMTPNNALIAIRKQKIKIDNRILQTWCFKESPEKNEEVKNPLF